MRLRSSTTSSPRRSSSEQALTHSDEAFYAKLRDEIEALDTANAQLVHIVERCAAPPDPQGDWTLWMEMWLQVRHRPHLRGTYERLERSGQQPLIAEVIRRGQRDGEFSVEVDAGDVATMLSALIDGLGVQVTLRHPDVTAERMTRLCLEAAALTLGFEPVRLTKGHETGSAPRIRAGAGKR